MKIIFFFLQNQFNYGSNGEDHWQSNGEANGPPPPQQPPATSTFAPNYVSQPHPHHNNNAYYIQVSGGEIFHESRSVLSFQTSQ